MRLQLKLEYISLFLLGFPGVMLTLMLFLWILKSVVEGKSSAL